MGSDRTSRSKRETSSCKSSHRRKHSQRRPYDDSESEPEHSSASASELASDSDSDSYHRRRSRSRSCRRSRHHSRDFDDHTSDDDHQKKHKKRKITEEDIAEYMAKKAQKKAVKVAKKLKAQNISVYANDSNQFEDSNLNERFVWRKKIERDITQGVPLDTFSLKAEKNRQRERMAEIEKVKKRREERAIEKAQHEEEMALLARERARAEFQDWEKKEEEFHFDQSKVRSEIRLREGRTKLIDILTKHLDPSDDLDIEINEPYMVFMGLTVKEMEELHEDIKMHLDFDRATPMHVQYWEERKRMAVREERRLQELTARPTHPEDNFEKKALKAMGAMEEGDALFGSNDEINLDSQVYWWHDKYRPRKPKYFNRVHTGYKWNKYNQTHYDHDNPPPKIVQGYKFNIFYPDLVDKGKAPTYVIEKDGDSSETCIIRFHAGPPYEEIAFGIVNKEWEYSHKKGFKCTFERGILHLYFNFKRHRYRR